MPYVADFETSVYEGQTQTEVWAAAISPITEDVDESHPIITNSIAKFFLAIKTLGKNPLIYFHNLKFDGSFIVDYLLRQKFTYDERRADEMENHTFKTLIDGSGAWYSLTIKNAGQVIEVRDSLKLLPFSVKKIGKDFNTKFQKAAIEYVGERHANGKITAEERDYIARDVLVMAEAMAKILKYGSRLTIGANCMADYRGRMYKTIFDMKFPALTKMHFIDGHDWGAENVEQYIRAAYRGGWCYLKKGREMQEIGAGITLDVNSLYPSQMHSQSGNAYPIGSPWKITTIQERGGVLYYTHAGAEYPLFTKGRFVFLRVRFSFKLKNGYLPTIQIKHDPRYNAREYLESSNIFVGGKEYAYETNADGERVPVTVTATFTQIDWWRIIQHYEILSIEYLDALSFKTEIGLFDEYINEWMEVKATSTGARRTVAKLRLNNLYGKFATRPDGAVKIPYIGDGDFVHYETIEEERNALYIPIGAAVTSYARDYTIKNAQANYSRFIYSDTDSLHLEGTDAPHGMEIHPTRLGAWALESTWKCGWFVRAKTYIHILDGNEWEIACAGLPFHCKQLFKASCTGERGDVKTEREKEFVNTKRTLRDFRPGLTIPGKLLAKTIKGGTVLVDTDFKMHEKQGLYG